MSTLENRESFFNRLKNPPFSCLLSDEQVERIELAYILAKYGHRAQARRGEADDQGCPVRYFEHPRRVALTLLDELRLPDPAMIMAALLHDCVEDTWQISPAKIRLVGGEEVFRIVNLLSKNPKAGYLDRLRDFADWKTLVVKACDRLDNLRTLPENDRAFQRKQVEETAADYFPLFRRMVEIAPAECRDRVAVLNDRLRSVIEVWRLTLDGWAI